MGLPYQSPSKLLEGGYSAFTICATSLSLLVEQGENSKSIQKQVGHAGIQTTFDVYGHLLTKVAAGIARAAAKGVVS